MKKWFYKIYMIGFMALTVFFMYVIWEVTFAHVIEEYHNRKQASAAVQMLTQAKQEKEKTTFQKVILESEEKVKYYLGYRVLEETRIKGHFHHIGFDIGPDKRSYCIECHGDMPHDDIKELRAFLNMHAFFVACQTCHMTKEYEKNITEYKWYDRKTGDIVESPVRSNRPGTYTAKIIPFEMINGKSQPADSKERVEFVREFKAMEKTISEAQKTKAKKMIHQIVSKQPHICEDCHQKEKPLLPLASLGYPRERIDSILGTEVIGLIKNYTKFYMPRMLHPGEPVPKTAQSEEKAQSVREGG